MSLLSVGLLTFALIVVLYGYVRSLHNRVDTKHVQNESRKRRLRDKEQLIQIDNREAIEIANSAIPDLPPPSFLFGHTKLVTGDVFIRTQEEIARKYGRLVPLYVGVRPLLLVTDVTMVKEITHDLADVFQNRSADIELKPNTGLVFARGNIWKRVRRTVSPTFSLSRMKPMASVMNAKASLLIQRITERVRAGEFDIHALLNLLTLDVIAETAFATDLRALEKEGTATEASEGKKLLDTADLLFGFLATRIGNPIEQTIIRMFPQGWKEWLLSLQRSDVVHALHSIEDYSTEMIIKRRQEHKEKGVPGVARDFLDLLLVAKDSETSQPLSDIEIRDQCNTFLLAGSDTTSNTLAYAIYLLSQNPEAENRVVQEISKLEEQIVGNSITFDDLKQLPYLDAVLKESQRMYPAVGIVGRSASRDVTLPSCGVHLPAGSDVHIPIWAMHYDPIYWENPKKFQPERFLIVNSSSVESAPLPPAFLPFGAGPRSCIGMKFAQMEAKLVLATLYHNFKFSLSKKTPLYPDLKLRASITISPKEGVWVTAENRFKSIN